MTSISKAEADATLSAIEYVEMCSLNVVSADPDERAALDELGRGDETLIRGLVSYSSMLEAMLVVALTKTRAVQTALATQTGEKQPVINLEADIGAIRASARASAARAVTGG